MILQGNLTISFSRKAIHFPAQNASPGKQLQSKTWACSFPPRAEPQLEQTTCPSLPQLRTMSRNSVKSRKHSVFCYQFIWLNLISSPFYLFLTVFVKEGEELWRRTRLNPHSCGRPSIRSRDLKRTESVFPGWFNANRIMERYSEWGGCRANYALGSQTRSIDEYHLREP